MLTFNFIISERKYQEHVYTHTNMRDHYREMCIQILTMYLYTLINNLPCTPEIFLSKYQSN